MEVSLRVALLLASLGSYCDIVRLVAHMQMITEGIVMLLYSINNSSSIAACFLATEPVYHGLLSNHLPTATHHHS